MRSADRWGVWDKTWGQEENVLQVSNVKQVTVMIVGRRVRASTKTHHVTRMQTVGKGCIVVRRIIGHTKHHAPNCEVNMNCVQTTLNVRIISFAGTQMKSTVALIEKHACLFTHRSTAASSAGKHQMTIILPSKTSHSTVNTVRVD